MSFIEKDIPTVGELFAEARAQLSANARSVAVFLAVCIPLDAASKWLSAGQSEELQSLSLPASLGMIVAQYFLFESFLRATGAIERDGRRRLLRFFGMGIVSLFGVLLAATLLLIPGLIVAARWLAAPCFLIATEGGVFASFGASWSMTHGRTTPVALALLVVGVAYFVLVGVLRSVAQAIGGSLPVAIVEGISNEVAWVVIIALSVAVYARLAGRSGRYAEVFA